MYHTRALDASRTANIKRQRQAENVAKDYGLSKLQTTLYVGRLSTKERQELHVILTRLFVGKRDQLHFLQSCRSCVLQSNIPEIVEAHYRGRTFEIV